MKNSLLIPISNETRNTKIIRKKIYCEALRIIENSKINGVYTYGFCLTIELAVSNLLFFDQFVSYIQKNRYYLNNKSIYKELLKYKPKEKNLSLGCYWFPVGTKIGTKKRIEILQSIIKSM